MRAELMKVQQRLRQPARFGPPVEAVRRQKREQGQGAAHPWVAPRTAVGQAAGPVGRRPPGLAVWEEAKARRFRWSDRAT